MKVKDLKKILSNLNDDVDIVRFGYFGEIYEFNNGDFYIRRLKKGDSPQGIIGTYLTIEPPDIGPEPD